MKQALILLVLLQTTLCADAKSRYRVYGVFYCPLEKEWDWSVALWKQKDSPDDFLFTGGKEGSTSAQFQTYFMEGDINDGSNKAGFEVFVTHTCHSDGKRRKLKKGLDAKIEKVNDEFYVFKANHLGEHPGELI